MLSRLIKRGTYTSDEGRYESHASLSARYSLTKPEEESQVAVNLLVTFKLSSSLNTLPCRSDLDEDSFLRDTERLIEIDQMLSLGYLKIISDTVREE